MVLRRHLVMNEIFIVSYSYSATMVEHDYSNVCSPVFVEGTDTPAFDHMPRAAYAYYLTYMVKGEIVASWRRNKRNNKVWDKVK
jgi:hypothetical protein